MEPELNIKIRDEDHITVTNNKKASLKMYSIFIGIFFSFLLIFFSQSLLFVSHHLPHLFHHLFHIWDCFRNPSPDSSWHRDNYYNCVFCHSS